MVKFPVMFIKGFLSISVNIIVISVSVRCISGYKCNLLGFKVLRLPPAIKLMNCKIRFNRF
jgi:hypothetical protein